MFKLLFFRFRVTNSRLKNKKMKLINEVVKWKKLLKYYSLNVREPLESILLLRFQRTSYNCITWGCPGILKSSSGMDVISNRWEFITSLFRDYIPIGYRDILIQKFWNVISRYLQEWAWSQTLDFLAAWSLWFVLLCFGLF